MIRLLAAIAKLIFLLNKEMKPKHEYSKSDDTKKYPDPLQSEIRLPVAITKYYESEQQEREGKNFRRCLVIVIEIVALSTAGSLAYLTWRTVEEIKRQGDIMKAQIVSDNRPWVSVDLLHPGGFEIGKNFSFDYKITNHGHTPAVGVYINSTSLLWQPGDGTDFAELEQRMCEFGSRNEPYGSGPFVLFPSQEYLDSTAFDVFSKAAVGKSLKEGKAFVEKSFKKGPNEKDFQWVNIYPYITGCVTYRHTFDNSIHRTPFTVQILRRPTIETQDNIHELLPIRTDIGPIAGSLISFKGFQSRGIKPD